MSEAADSSRRLRQLEQILADAKTPTAASYSSEPDPADVHLGSVPIERIRQLTAQLQQRVGNEIDDIDAMSMRLLLCDYRAAVAHLRTMAQLIEQRVTAATAPIQNARLLVRRKLKPAQARERSAPPGNAPDSSDIG